MQLPHWCRHGQCNVTVLAVLALSNRQQCLIPPLQKYSRTLSPHRHTRKRKKYPQNIFKSWKFEYQGIFLKFSQPLQIPSLYRKSIFFKVNEANSSASPPPQKIFFNCWRKKKEKTFTSTMTTVTLFPHANFNV